MLHCSLHSFKGHICLYNRWTDDASFLVFQVVSVLYVPCRTRVEHSRRDRCVMMNNAWRWSSMTSPVTGRTPSSAAGHFMKTMLLLLATLRSSLRYWYHAVAIEPIFSCALKTLYISALWVTWSYGVFSAHQNIIKRICCSLRLMQIPRCVKGCARPTTVKMWCHLWHIIRW